MHILNVNLDTINLTATVILIFKKHILKLQATKHA